jgi:hypothetical protein
MARWRSGLVLIALAGAACNAGVPASTETPGDPSPWVQTGWAFRTDTLPLPSSPAGLTTGPEGSEGGPPVVFADRPFRIRFELTLEEADPVSGSDDPRFTLQARKNDGEWVDLLPRDFPYPDEISTPPVSVVRASTWEQGAETGDLIDGSEAPFAGGSAVSLDSITAAGSVARAGAGAVQTEWEWPVVIRRYADGARTNDVGDTFQFRMVDGGGRPAGGVETAELVLEVPSGLLGGTYAETPGVLGPWQARDGSLYFPMEPAETFNVLMMVHSRDHGVSWSEVDGANRPRTDDLEGFATVEHQGRIYMLHQISEATYLHAFATSDEATAPDRWVVRDELVARHSEPPTQVAALVADPDGALTAFYADSLGLLTRTRTPAGEWGEERRLDGPPGTVASGVMATRLEDGRIHVAYTATGARERSVWFREIRADGAVGTPRQIATGVGLREEDIGAVAPLVHLPESGITVILYRLADGYLYSRSVGSESAGGALTEAVRVTDRQVVQNGADSEQVGVDAVVHAGRVYVAAIDEETRDLLLIEGRPDATVGIAWRAPRTVVADVNAQWVRGRVIRGAGGEPVYGVVYDAGSNGGSGMNRYIALPLTE